MLCGRFCAYHRDGFKGPEERDVGQSSDARDGEMASGQPPNFNVMKNYSTVIYRRCRVTIILRKYGELRSYNYIFAKISANVVV